jgi:hypothetical protein
MYNVCPHCGAWDENKPVDLSGPVLICPNCGYRQPFRRLPLFFVTGASGAGKTAACLTLAPRMTDCVCMETDILWRAIPTSAEDNYRSYRRAWLRLAFNIAQSGRPVALFGTACPDQHADLPEARLFSAMHYLALVCDDTTLAQRLRDRPPWRGCDESFITEMVSFNRWLITNAPATEPPMSLLDTTHRTLDETAREVEAWMVMRAAEAAR